SVLRYECSYIAHTAITARRMAGAARPARSPTAGGGEGVAEVQDSVAVGLRSGERELGCRAGVSEQPPPGTGHQRVDDQVQAVGQAAGEQRPDQGPAATDVDAALDPVLQIADRARAITAKDGGVAPTRGPQRGGDDVLGRLVHKRRAGVILSGPGGPRAGELLAGAASQQKRPAPPHDSSDSLTHPRIEPAADRPGPG